jgi:hypothetical protein
VLISGTVINMGTSCISQELMAALVRWNSESLVLLVSMYVCSSIVSAMYRRRPGAPGGFVQVQQASCLCALIFCESVCYCARWSCWYMMHENACMHVWLACVRMHVCIYPGIGSK